MVVENLVNLEKNQTVEITKEITDNSGRVSDFTLQNFFLNMWFSIFIATIILIFFNVYRRLRKDDQTFKLKIKNKTG